MMVGGAGFEALERPPESQLTVHGTLQTRVPSHTHHTWGRVGGAQHSHMCAPGAGWYTHTHTHTRARVYTHTRARTHKHT